MFIDEVTYCSGRAKYYLGLASDAADPKLKEAYEAVAMEFSTRGAGGDPNRQLRLIGGVAPEL